MNRTQNPQNIAKQFPILKKLIGIVYRFSKISMQWSSQYCSTTVLAEINFIIYYISIENHTHKNEPCKIQFTFVFVFSFILTHPPCINLYVYFITMRNAQFLSRQRRNAPFLPLSLFSSLPLLGLCLHFYYIRIELNIVHSIFI